MRKSLLLAVLATSFITVQADSGSIDVRAKALNEDGNTGSGFAVDKYNKDGTYVGGSFEFTYNDDYEFQGQYGFGATEDINNKLTVYGYVNGSRDTVDFAAVRKLAVGVGADLKIDLDGDYLIDVGGRAGLAAGDACGVDNNLYGQLSKKLSTRSVMFARAEMDYNGEGSGCSDFFKAAVEAGFVYNISDKMYVKATIGFEGSDLDDFELREEQYRLFGYDLGSEYYIERVDVSGEIEPKYELEFGVRF